MNEAKRKEAEATQAREAAASEKMEACEARVAAEEAVAVAERACKAALKAKTTISELSWTQARAQGHSPLTESDMIYMLVLTPALKAHDNEKSALRKKGRLTKPMQKRLKNKMDALCVAKLLVIACLCAAVPTVCASPVSFSPSGACVRSGTGRASTCTRMLTFSHTALRCWTRMRMSS